MGRDHGTRQTRALPPLFRLLFAQANAPESRAVVVALTSYRAHPVVRSNANRSIGTVAVGGARSRAHARAEFAFVHAATVAVAIGAAQCADVVAVRSDASGRRKLPRG